MDIKVFQSIDPGDYKVTPFVATKTISVTDSNYTNNGTKMFRGVYKQSRFQDQGFYLHNISSSAYSRDSLETNYGLTSNGDGVDVNYHFIKQGFMLLKTHMRVLVVTMMLKIDFLGQE